MGLCNIAFNAEPQNRTKVTFCSSMQSAWITVLTVFSFHVDTKKNRMSE
jgi:hypothetical protein